MKGRLFNWSHHSSVISIALSIPSPSCAWFLCSPACLISSWQYWFYNVFSTLKKKSRSGILPVGILSGKCVMNSTSCCINGYSFTTLSSSYSGTCTNFTSLSLRSFFWLRKTSFRKSLLI